MSPYFTNWSVGFLMLSVLLCVLCRSPVTLGIMAAALANTAVVSVGGPAVFAHGQVHGTCREQHVGNLNLHAIPMLAAFCILCVWKQRAGASVSWAVASLAAIDAVWAVHPYKGCRFLEKVKCLYGVDAPPALAFILAQIGGVMLITML